jgi:leucine-zipper of insertion element IS481
LSHAASAPTSKTVAKWVDRFNAQGLEGLRGRSSRPHSLPSQISLATADAVEGQHRAQHEDAPRTVVEARVRP